MIDLDKANGDNGRFLVSFEDVSLKFPDGTNLFKNLNFKIKKNTINLLIGPTGSGKTTIIQLIKGIIPYLREYELKGRILVKNEEKTSDNFFQQSIDVGYLIQDIEMQFVGSTVEKELIFSLENFGFAREIIKQRLKWFKDKYPILKDLLNRRPHTLSGGELSQVEFLSILMNDPDIMLFDEPFAYLDKFARESFLSLLKSVKGKKTIVIATHELYPFLEITDNIYQLEQIDNETIIKNHKTKDFLEEAKNIDWLELTSLLINDLKK